MAKIIVADDEMLIRRLVCDFLIKEGHTPLEAADGKMAVELFNRNPDTALIIMDIMMPELDGWEATREIRRHSAVPIMLLSARSQDFDQLTGFESGADDYVTKPFSPAVLMKRVEALLRRSGSGFVSDTDGSFFEIQENAMSDTQFIVYGKSLNFGGDLEMYSKKTTIDSYADTAINVMLITSILALCATLVAIYFYSKKFTKPLIEMSSVTGGMADMDFSKKCEYGGNDEIGTLASSINELSDSLNSTLVDLNEKNRRLQEDIEKEQQLDKIRKDFISNVSHELKTPISIIQGYSEGAKLMLDSGDTKGASEYCEIITDETHKMNMLVLQLLELSMYESGNVKLSMDKIDIRAAAEEYGEENRLKFESKGIKFINDIPSDCFGLGDSVKIRMVFNNYISNACSHVSGDNIIRVYKGQSQNEGSIRICVYNSGSHIDSDDMDKIWISFYRADKSHSRAEGRFGLGLSIVGAIQKLHGEKYGAENTDDGVVFWFDIKKA